MTQREVRLFGDPVLKTVSAEVTDIDAGIKTLVGDMLETMDAHNGVGLAANQVGVTRRVIVFDCTHETPGARGHLINPVWEPIGAEKQLDDEGYLSIPEVYQEVERFQKVRATGLNVDGETVEFEAEGLLARCIQHEVDHVDGVLFLQRLAPADRKEAMKTIRHSEWFNK